MRSPRTATKSSPHSLQLEKAHAQQQRPDAAKNKYINFKKKYKYSASRKLRMMWTSTSDN